MNRVLQTTTTFEKKELVRDSVMLNREFLFLKDAEDLYIKYDDELLPIGGNCKQNRFEAGSNIEIIKDGDSKFHLDGENGKIWVSNLVDHSLTVGYVSRTKLESCQLYIADVISENNIFEAQEMDCIEEDAEHDIFNYEITVSSAFFESYRRIRLVVQAFTSETDSVCVPQGDIEEPKTWAHFYYGSDIVRLSDDIVVNTATLWPAERDIIPWKGTVSLGKLVNSNSVLLLMKATELSNRRERAFLGGEILVKMTMEDGEARYGHYAFSCSSTGSWSLKGATEAESSVRMIKAKWKGSYYYGLKIPNVLAWRDQEVEEVYAGYDTENPVVQHSKFQLRIGDANNTNKDRNHLEVLDENGNVTGIFTDTGIVTGNNTRRHIQYISLKSIIPNMQEEGALYAEDDIAKYFNNAVGYFLYFDVLYEKLSSTAGFGLRLLGGYICNQSGNYDPSQYPDRVLKVFDSESKDWVFWNHEVVVSSGQTTVPYSDSRIDLCEIVFRYAPFRDDLTRWVIVDTEYIETPKMSEFWFNGWKHIPLKPTGFRDMDIESVAVLADKSNDNDSFADTFYVTAPEVGEIVKDLEKTGEDGAPYRIFVQGPVSMHDLEIISIYCKDPEVQIWLDFTNAYVDSTAENWETEIFQGCVSLRGLIIPQGVKKIKATVFMWCTYLQHLDLLPSKYTLKELGAAGGWGTSIGLFTSTRIRHLQVPGSVSKLDNYINATSNLKSLILLHENMDPLEVEQWTWAGITQTGAMVSYVNVGFHLFISKSWDEGYLRDFRNSYSAWQWANSGGWWVPDIVDAVAVYDPDWSADEWQEFNDIYEWGEDLINDIRKKFGHPDGIEIKEKNPMLSL